MAHPPMIYGLGAELGGEEPEIEYTGAAGRLPGAVQFAAGVLINTIALDDEEVSFQNDGTTTGWFMGLQRGIPAAPTDPAVILLTLSFGVVGALTDQITVPIGSASNEWLFVAFTITLDEATTMCTVYVNGEVAYTIALNGAVIPSADVPRLQTETVVGATLISWAFYTEGLVTANGMAIFNAQLKKSAGTIDWAFNAGTVALQHIYSATESMRPLASDVWADTGSVPNAPLTLSEGTPIARVLPGDFAQAVIGPIVDPDGPVVP